MPEVKILHGDSLKVLKEMEAESIDCVVTSPPYWGLRDYGVDGQLGQEADFREFIENLCLIFDEISRVLKPTGTLWVNLGDTYMNNSSYQEKGRAGLGNDKIGMIYKKDKSVRQKSLCNIPNRFAIGMTDRGWILRNEIIWHKPNAMPQSMTDRFTVDYEKVFMFVKNPKYHFEQQFEPWVQRPGDIKRASEGHQGYQGKNADGKNAQGIKGQPVGDPTKGRNMRSVWTIPTKSYTGAHFAVYPEELIAPMLKASCPKDGVVLDPFFGSGTTGVVARKLGLDCIGIELNEEYIKIAEGRLAQEVLL